MKAIRYEMANFPEVSNLLYNWTQKDHYDWTLDVADDFSIVVKRLDCNHSFSVPLGHWVSIDDYGVDIFPDSKTGPLMAHEAKAVRLTESNVYYVLDWLKDILGERPIMWVSIVEPYKILGITYKGTAIPLGKWIVYNGRLLSYSNESFMSRYEPANV